MLDSINPSIELTAHARCDRCGSQAYVQATRDDVPSELLFCMHHYRRNEHTLVADGWDIIVDAIKADNDFRPNTIDA